jgi:hypothetical protein
MRRGQMDQKTGLLYYCTDIKSMPITIATPHNNRGMIDLLAMLSTNPAQDAAHAIVQESRPFVVCTGFPVNGHPETDGPPGAFALIDALRKLKKKAIIASWRQALQIFKEIRPDIDAFEVTLQESRSVPPNPDQAVITIEVCGKLTDGAYRNMRGENINDAAPKFESVFGITSFISVGDGGNEFGMGSAPDKFFSKWNIVKPISTTEHLVPASTSNYAVYALIRELEIITGLSLLPNPDDHVRLIKSMVQLGCVDGYTGEPQYSVDGEDLEHTHAMIRTLQDL